MSSRAHFLQPLLHPGGASLGLYNTRTSQVLAQQLEFAADSRTRRRGLLGRAGLAPHAAMIIAPCNAIHTFFMRFTIDVVFANREGYVLRLCPNLRPWRMAMAIRGFAAIELAAGSIGAAGLRPGDQLGLQPVANSRP